MKRELVNDIYKRLISENWSCLPSYLKGGQMEICMFMALYSEDKNSRKARSLSARIFPKVIDATNKLPYRLFDGRIGVAWGMKYLSNNNILEENDIALNIHKSLLNEYLYQSASMPIYLPAKESIFSIGIYLAQLFKQEDSLQRYVIEERLLALIDECDRLLHYKIKGIYAPKALSLSMLHSILFFLRKMGEEGIYPYQIQNLLKSTDNVYHKIKNRNLLDDYIYHVLINEVNHLPKIHTPNFYIEFLGNLGLYSLLYECPDIFNIALGQLSELLPSFYTEMRQIIREGSISIETLCGWGFGLLTHKKVNYE